VALSPDATPQRTWKSDFHIDIPCGQLVGELADGQLFERWQEVAHRDTVNSLAFSRMANVSRQAVIAK